MNAVVLTQGIAALLVGTFLSTVIIAYNQRFGLDAARAGTLVGIGEGIGMSIMLLKGLLPSLIKAKDKSDNSASPNVFQMIIARPLNVPFILFVAGTSSMLFSIDNKVFAIVCQLFFSSVDDLSSSLMGELVATSLPPEKFQYYQGISQWLRRLGQMVTAVLGPLFFDINDAFPFVFFGKYTTRFEIPSHCYRVNR